MPTPEDTLKVTDPATGERITEVACATEAEVLEAVRAARAAQRKWARVPVRERVARVQAVASAYLADADALAREITREMGKPHALALAEVQGGRSLFEYYAEQVPPFFAPRDVEKDARRSRILREPVGVIGAITPWNFPANIPLWTLVPALMCGNAVVLKPSELVPLTGARIHAHFAKQLPAGLVALCQGADEVGKAVVGSDVDMIAFVGSRAVGKAIMAASAPRLRRLALELGGKDPMLVLADADLDRAARGAVWGAVSNCGQICCSVERIYVEAPVAGELEARIKKILPEIRVGKGSDPATTMGPMASAEQRAHVLRQIDDAVRRGARLEAGGKAIPGPGFFIEPTLLVDVDESMEIAREETFGPVIALRRVSGVDEAVRLANDTRYGLGASVYSRNEERALEVAGRLEAGTVGVNRGTGSFILCPWGGVKESGMGRMLGMSALEEFTQTKVLHLA